MRFRAGLLAAVVCGAMYAPIAASPASATFSGANTGDIVFVAINFFQVHEGIVSHTDSAVAPDTWTHIAYDDGSLNLEPAYSPDGATVAFVSNRDGNSEIFRAAADGSNITQLTSTSGVTNRSPKWSPDGSKIVFVSDRDGHDQLYTMSATDGSLVTRITNEAADSETPSWSPDGNTVAFSRIGNNGGDIYAIAPDGTNEHSLIATGSNSHPDWSPDGSQILYQHSYATYLANSNGTGSHVVSDGSGNYMVNAVFSPDGTRIAYTSQPSGGGNTTIRTMSVLGFDVQTVASASGFDLDQPNWSPMIGLSNSTPPSISGTTMEGNTLTADPGTWSGSPTFAYQWLRCASSNTCVAIPGETAATHDLVFADVGNTMRVLVKAADGDAIASAYSPATATIVPIPPANDVLPALSGTFHAGDGTDLAASPGTWMGIVDSYSYQWERCDALGDNCVDFADTSTSYTLVGGDIGSTLRVKVTAMNAGGSVMATSDASPVVVLTDPPANSVLPLVTLSVTGASTKYGTWSDVVAGPSPYAVQWQRCAAGGSSCADIPG
ncbi:MAG TPA: hypothetical protein VFR41_11035, partial [Acidimicrobiia bacterium]|nr:hypothetical protein [Acidimicrobiia bacterium]